MSTESAESATGSNPGTSGGPSAARIGMSRAERMDGLFARRTYEVVKEINLAPDQGTFTTPFGNKGRHGFHLRLTSGPSPVVPGVGDEFIVGETVLRAAAQEYQSVEIPERPERGRRRRKSKAGDQPGNGAGDSGPAAPADGPG